MAALPVFPAFAPNDASLAKLQQLSAATAFASTAPVIFRLYKTASQVIPAIPAQVPVIWDAAAADTDGGWAISSATRYTARTPGYFHCDFGVNCVTSGTTDGQWQIALRVTTGPGNPGGAGTVTYIAMRGDDMGTSAQQESLQTSAATPYLYIGDYLEVTVFCTLGTTTITAGWNNSGNSDLGGFADGSPSFTGMLVSLGP